MPDRRVVITGLGAVTPLGVTRDGLWTGVHRERSAVRKITRFDSTGYRAQVAAEVDGFDPSDYLPGDCTNVSDRYTQYLLSSAVQAVDDSGLDFSREDRERAGAYVGSAIGGAGHAESQFMSYIDAGVEQIGRRLAHLAFAGSGASDITIQYGLRGPVLTNANSCASGTIAIGSAFRTIKSGATDVMLAGGGEAPIFPLTFGAFAVIRAMTAHNEEPERASRPFHKRRDGFVMAEGALILVLEELSHALSRDAHIYGEILGYGVASDGYHMTAPLPTGEQAARSMRLAMREAGVCAEEIEYVSAHGSSTPLNDSTETLAIKRALGDRAYRVPVSATKGMHGHALGASGAMELGICLLSFAEDYLPPTVNLDEVDEECDLDYIPMEGRQQRVSRIISNSFGFGGINAAIVLGRFEE